MERDEQPSTSDDGQSLALREMIVEKLESILLKKHEPDQQRVLKIVKEESQKLLLGGTRNDVPKERILLLKFLDEVKDPVHTSRELRGIKGYPLQVALLDETGKTVTCGPESSASVEIVLADASGKDGGHNATHGNFERRIIKTRDKKKPHFAKSVCINLEGGVGNLIGVKLGQSSEWTKNSKCSLGVRLVEKFRGITVQEGWTAPFLVKDNRSTLNEKHDPPLLGSEVWRLKEINRKGEPFKRLEKEKIMTVQDFLFWLSVNREGLQKILCAGDKKWKTIVEHAQTCNIDDKKIFFHKSSTEPQMGVIYDAVGNLKGVINESRFVPIDNLSADKKEHAHKLLSSVLERSAFEERYETSFDDEASLLQRYPSSINFSIQQSWNGNYLPPSGNINIHQPTGPGSSFPSNSPININEHFANKNLSDAFEYNNGGAPTDLVTLGCRSQNAGTFEVVGERSSSTPSDRVLSMTSSFEDMGGVRNDPWYSMHRDMANVQMYSHADESNADDGNAAPVEPQAVNADDETVEPQAVNIHQPTGPGSSFPSNSPININEHFANMNLSDAFEYNNGCAPTDLVTLGCRSQNAGTSEAAPDRVISMMSSFDGVGGVRNDPLYGFMQASIQKYSHADESNADDGNAAPVEPQAVNADDETVEPQAVNIHQPTGTDSSFPSISPLTISVDDYLASKYDNGGTPTDQGCRRQNAGTSELVGESSRSETSSMNFTFEDQDIDGVFSIDELVDWIGNFDVPNTQAHSHTNELNVDDGGAAPVEPQAVNTDDNTVEPPQAVNTSNPLKWWKRVFCVMLMISKRVLDVAPKRKRQKVA